MTRGQAAYLTLLTELEVIAPSVLSTTDDTATDSPTDPPAPPTAAPTAAAPTAPPPEPTEPPVAEPVVEYQGPPDSESSGESAVDDDTEISVDLSGKSDPEPTVLATTDLPDTTYIETTVTTTPPPPTAAPTTAAPKPLATNPSIPVSRSSLYHMNSMITA